MNHFSDGFLSEPTEPTVALVRTRYPDWRALLLNANKLAVDLQHTINIHQGESREVYGAVLFARTISSVQASVILLERGLIPQARAILRVALESYFALSAIAQKPEIVKRLVEAHEAEQKRVAKNMQQWKHPELQEIAQTHSQKYDRFLTSKAKFISTYDLAEAGGNEDLYRTVYTVFSWSVHGASTDLERHLVVGKDCEITEFRNEPEIDSQESSWSCGIELLTKAIRSLGIIFSPLEIKSVEPLEQQHVQLLDRL